MIIVELMGGLGNQMFQYAAGRRLAHSLGVDLKLDISGLKKDPLRHYALGAFNIVEHFPSLIELFLLQNEKQHKIIRISKQILPTFFMPFPRQIKESHFHFDKGILSLSDNVYLCGYWQSEKYFLDIEDIIRSEFTGKFQQTGKNFEFAKKIKACESVSIHVRRGDYITDAHTNRTHGVCSVEYYHRCIDKIKQYSKDPVFFAFSDDPDWVRKNLHFASNMTLVDHNTDEKSFEDLLLMSQCRHHIIANSSFSWWGAWLNKHSAKLVFAPSQWFGNERQASRNMNDLLPDTWEKCGPLISEPSDFYVS